MQCLSFNFKSSRRSPSSSFPTSPQTQTQSQSQTQSMGLPSSPPLSQGNSADGSPRSSATQLSPTINLSREYTLVLQTNSYNEIRSRIEQLVQVEIAIESGDTEAHQQRLLQVLHPNADSVHEALRHTNPNATLTRLVSTYFDHSENFTTQFLILYQRIRRARTLYAPITDLLQVLPYDLSSINELQCNWAIDVFRQFNNLENPFPSPDSHNFNEMRHSLSQLYEQLDHRLKSHSTVHFLHRMTTGSAISLIGTIVGAVVSVVVISTDAFASIVGLVATPLCPVFVPSHLKKKQLARINQLDTAARGTCIHKADLGTIGCLVALLYDAVEDDMKLIRFGLERDGDIYPLQVVVKHLRNNGNKFFERLKELEQRICLCLNSVNQFRAKLLDQIHLHQSSNS